MRLGGLPVLPGPAVEIAVEAIFLEEIAGRNDLCADQPLLGILPLDLAEIGRFPAPEQRFQQRLLRGAADFDIQVAAAGGVAGMIGGSTRCLGAGVGVGGEREGPLQGGGGRQMPGDQLPVLDDPEAILPQPARRCRAARYWNAATEAVGSAFGLATVRPELQILAGDVHRCLAPELTIRGVAPPEIESLSVPEEPGRVVVLLPLEGGDPDRDIEGTALSTKAAAGRWSHRVPGAGEYTIGAATAESSKLGWNRQQFHYRGEWLLRYSWRFPRS